MWSNIEEILQNLNTEQQMAVKEEKNAVLIACPGSGKTRTIVHRLAYLSLKYPTSRRLNIAITYTNRASDEMERRLDDLDIGQNNIWTGTIHQFCMEFIIRPYSMYSERLRFGYRIIDEYTKLEYGKKIADELAILVKYNKYFENPVIVKRYKEIIRENKEIDFDDILIESIMLLHNYKFIAENISAIIRSIMVDEYQDTNEIQYKILAELYSSNTTMNIMFVGDPNQAIYSTLGGVAKTVAQISELFGVTFHKLLLSGCYRSTQRLIDFYSKYALDAVCVNSCCEYASESGVITYLKNLDTSQLTNAIGVIIERELKQGIAPNEICVAAPQWSYLYELSKSLRKLLPNLDFDAPQIVPFKYDPMNPFYLIAWLTFTEPGKSERLRKSKATEILSILKSDFGIHIPDNFDNLSLLSCINGTRISTNQNDGIELYKMIIRTIFRKMGIDIESEHMLKRCFETFIDETEDRVHRFHLLSSTSDLESCFKERKGIVITTIHAMKGEEYHSVIAFGLLNGILPNWNDIIDRPLFRKDIAYRLLYVLISRAKKNIFLISETGRKTNTGNPYYPTDELQTSRMVFDDYYI